MYRSAQLVQIGAHTYARAAPDPTRPHRYVYWTRVAASHWRALTLGTALCDRIDAALDNPQTSS